ncbi:MAG: penicillin-binding protein activator [[Pasteurella] aerogenes]|nr:penicillin-binding protein activator [[Pasteurella] aerogenes]
MPILLQCIHLKKRLIPFFFALVLAGCANIFSNSFTDTLKNDANANSDFYINRIEQAKSVEDQQTYKLLAARVLVTENKVASAEAFLAELKDLTEPQLLDKSIVDAHVSAVKKNNQLAKSQLAAINLALLSPSQKARYYEVAARIAENQNDTIEAVKARIQIDNFLTDTQRKQENNDRTWALLRNTNRGVINNTVVEGSPALAGWIALAKAYNDNINNPAQLSQALQNWKSSYPSHSAAYLFPTELRGLFNFQGTNLSQIALLLPLSDNAQLIGNTIKKGFDDARGDSPIQVTVFDTMTQPIESIIEQAKQQGITTLVGPLLKQNIDTLLNNPANIQGLSVLALNSTPNARAIGQLCYYGLSPEDEAESAANKMWNDGIRNPLVLVPQADVGQRTASAFNVRWQQLAATDANIRFYNNPDDINFALQEGLSQNAEALYIVATSEQLAEIKTSVDNTNRNLKLYASSRSNSPNNGPEYRLLMNGLQFSDIPFFKDTSSAQYRQIEQMTNGDYSLMRLYAMGADAWLLINQFNELRQVPGFSINGLTGKLSAGPNCNVERDMTWFVYQNADVVAIN